LSIVAYESLPQDKTPKCTLAKSIRHRLGLKWKLQNQGLTNRELEAKKRWDSMPEEEKKARIEALKKNSPIVKLSAKGYIIAPRSRDSIQNTYKTEEKSTNEDIPQESSNG
jgi:hypothetical protein